MGQREHPNGFRSIVEPNFLSSMVSSLLTFTVFFIIILQIYGKKFGGEKRKQRKGKNWNPEWDGLPGLETIPSIKSVVPIKMIGALPKLLPFEKTIETATKWGAEYGEIFQADALGATWVILNSAELCQTLLKSTDNGHSNKAPIVYDLMKPFIEKGLLVSTGKLHQSQRKTLLKSQSYQHLKAYIPMLNKHCKRFVAGLDDLFKDDKPHEINELINASFIKVISEMITGYNDDDSVEYAEYHHNFQTWKEAFIRKLLHPWLIIKPIWKLHPLSRRHDKAVAEMFEFAKRRIRDNRLAREERQAMKEKEGHEEQNEMQKRKFKSIVDELIDAGVDDRQIIDEINTMMFGGHETGASAVHCFLFCMALHPEIQKECQREIDELFENPLTHRNGQLTFDGISSNLKYVERCMLETLRLLPPVFVFFRKLETSLKINHNGQDCVIPEGTNAVVFPHILHRKPEYYPDPEKYDPDRFLPEETEKRHAYAFLPFSAGPRNCLGIKFAYIEMKIIIAHTLRHFTFTTEDRMEDIPMMPYLTLTPKKDYTFKCVKRNFNNGS